VQDITPRSNSQLIACEMLKSVEKELTSLAFLLDGQINMHCVVPLDKLNFTNIADDIKNVSIELHDISKSIREISLKIYMLKENGIR
jgi:hypothetical protein